jgi:general stress protein YciG
MDNEKKVMLMLVVERMQAMASGETTCMARIEGFSDKQVIKILEGLMRKLTKTNRGFANWSPERQREVASKGGRSAHETGAAHHWTSEDAKAAGRVGGAIISQNRAHMSAIGRKGGVISGIARRAKKEQESEVKEEVDQTKQS